MNKREIEKLVKLAAKLNNYEHFKFGKDAKILPDQSREILFSCPVCGETYQTASEAVACRDQPFDNDDLEVGDIVVVPGKWTVWYDEDDPWVAFTVPADPSSKSHFDHKPQCIPYYVVMAVHNGPRYNSHRCLVTLARPYTGQDGKRYLDVGWNPADGNGHHVMFQPGQDISDIHYYGDKFGELFDQCEPSKELKREAAILADIGISTDKLL